VLDALKAALALIDQFVQHRHPSIQVRVSDSVGVKKVELVGPVKFWRKVLGGDASVKDYTAVSDADIERCNLILWGDPSSNAVLGRI